ncbi:DUF4376 domain-containing protein [Salmonella enterica]|nr:DUF4376 domain-containing protein [Salmonella enterica]EDE4043515.1 DUF4376 domain-containing protein [Salmonella enterica subsp. enterica serovar Bareilly]EDT3088570.1 DUF4376 domain-containing protein [Salmonella enterica subsp. enterica serovar Newport]EAM8739227.1 DUF4376 domain-containing protein [Salmonella enterica]EAQ0547471.1 DUF4376 domain-containing protein [Salmonella enterica]
MYHYSPSNNAFYPDELKQVYIDAGSFPDDTVEVDDDIWLEFAGNHPPEGKERAAGSDNQPCWVDIPLPDIEDARNQKHAEINAWRDQQENGSTTFDWNGHKWDAGKASQDRLAPVLVVAKSGQLPDGFFWTDASNEDVPVTVDDLIAIDAGMTQAMVIQGFKIHERQRQMKKDIAELTKVSDILNYSVGWADNNGN